MLLFFLLQFLNGKYTGIEGAAWAWVFAQLLPGLGVLWAATLLNLNADKAILRWAFWGIAGRSLAEGFEDLYQYLLPLQGLALAVFGLLFFKKEGIFQPNVNILRDHVGQQLANLRRQSDLGIADPKGAKRLRGGPGAGRVNLSFVWLPETRHSKPEP